MEKQIYNEMSSTQGETVLDLICEQHDTIQMLKHRITELEGLDDGLPMSQESEEPDPDELRFRKHRVTLTNQAIIKFAYLTKDVVEGLAKNHTKLLFEEANCYTACFYDVCEMLKLVDPEYRAIHRALMTFYREDRWLSTTFDRLYWEERTPPDDTVENKEGTLPYSYHESLEEIPF